MIITCDYLPVIICFMPRLRRRTNSESTSSKRVVPLNSKGLSYDHREGTPEAIKSLLVGKNVW